MEMLTFRPIGDVLGETKRALADLKVLFQRSSLSILWLCILSSTSSVERGVRVVFAVPRAL